MVGENDKDLSGLVTYGVMRPGEAAQASAIYVDRFPTRWKRWFARKEAARRFFGDVIELLRRACGDLCLVARRGKCVVGFVVITLPDQRLLPVLLRTGLIWRVISSTLLGRYGRSAATFVHAGRSLFSLDRSDIPVTSPHVYVIAVAPGETGGGVGGKLLELARRSIPKRFDSVWLLVDRTNIQAIRFYERHGFRGAGVKGDSRIMIHDLGGGVDDRDGRGR